MDYEEFSKAIAWTIEYWACRKEKRQSSRKCECKKFSDFSYAALRERGDDYWLHLERMSEDDLDEEIINCFLNSPPWYCYLPDPGTVERRQVVGNLKKAVDQLRDAYAALIGFRIEDIDFQNSNMVIIDHIYFSFCTIDPEAFRKVPASKLMHMALPSLFIMWDDDIIKSYRVPKLEGYLSSYTTFLMLMQENVRHIKETNPTGSSVTNEELFRQINKQCGEKDLPITRLLDIANYAISRNKERYQKCHRCIEATNSKLAVMQWYPDERFKPKQPFFDC